MDTLAAQGFTLGKALPDGDICHLWACTQKVEPVKHEAPPMEGTWFDMLVDDTAMPDPTVLQCVVKVSATVADNDLVQHEVHNLRCLWPAGEPETKFLRYLPRLVTSFVADGLRHNVLTLAEGHVSLVDVMRVYPDGLDYRDAAWMLKRVLSALGFAHELGVVHGAILPEHVLVHPTGHGAKIVDWCYSVAMRDRMSIRAIVAAHRDDYPPEVFARQFPTPATDIYMVARLFQRLMGGKAPAEVQALLAECLREKPSERPQHAWALHDRFDGVLRGLVGKPTYRPLAMPGA